MEACCSRFTAWEGGARLATAASSANTMLADHTSFIAMRLLHEHAYKIRGSLSDGTQRSVYVTRPSRVACVAYDLNILTDLRVTPAVRYCDVDDWRAEIDGKEVLVCTSAVIKQILEEEVLTMSNINVLIIDSCHLICKDEDLKFIMTLYKEAKEENRPRILALTYPLFSSNKTQNHDDKQSESTESDKGDNDKSEKDDLKADCADNNETQEKSEKTKDNIEVDCETDKYGEVSNESSQIGNDKSSNGESVDKMGVYENLDDFKMYEKLEWKIDVLEKELCCKADLAEDIDGVKRFSATITKPKEFIIEYSSQSDATDLPETYFELYTYMKDTVQDALDFLNEHRYDPTEIYGEDMYEELKGIPDPILEPKQIFTQFLYVLDQLGPYGADKAALSLLTKLEKLKIKVPYERHFLLLCICTSVFVKIRCYADFIFGQYENDWEKVKRFCTPKVLRLAEVLEKFKPPADNADIDNTKPKVINQEDTRVTNQDENRATNQDDNSLELNTATQSDTKNTDSIQEKIIGTEKLLNAIAQCDFIGLSNKIEDKVNSLEMNLKDIDLTDSDTKTRDDGIPKNEDQAPTENVKNPNISDEISNQNDQPKEVDLKPNFLQKGTLFGFPRRTGNRIRGRGRVPRTNVNRAQQMLLNPDALCGIVFIKDALMAKILFMLVADLSRSNPNLKYLCAQYSAIEKPADPLKEPREFEQQRKKQEEVLKKFRMHECNLLLATAAVEEGIDLPRCNLVLRWDVPPSYRSYGLCRGRARAPRSACVLLSHALENDTDKLMHNLATYKELDQIVSRKCGCGVQDEPPQTEEDHADSFTTVIQPYTPINNSIGAKNHKKPSDKLENNSAKVTTPNQNDKLKTSANMDKEIVQSNENETEKSDISNKESKCDKCNSKIANSNQVCLCVLNISESVTDVKVNDKKCDSAPKNETSDPIASVDLSTAIALINRYCGKLPSDTFTRLAPQWWMECVQLPDRNNPGQKRDAYICTLRLPLNCPVKYNIVGHPMPTRVLARRMVALQACRILHKSGELDNQLMPIGKDNFKAAELEVANGTYSNPAETTDPSDMARPGTTKRRQYYYKRTARVFTDCQPIIDTSDSEIDRPIPVTKPETAGPAGESPKIEAPGVKRNMLYAIVCSLWCALPERYNTRGRRLHAPQSAKQALGILCARAEPPHLQIPAFPVYTRSGEVRVSVEHVPGADVRMSPRRGRLVRRFMRFVFAGVLRVRRRGMKLQSEGSTHNNYYIVPTIKTTREDGSTKIDIDWSFLELIYQHTEEKKLSELEKPILWDQDEEEAEDIKSTPKNENEFTENKDTKEKSVDIQSKPHSKDDNTKNDTEDIKIEIDNIKNGKEEPEGNKNEPNIEDDNCKTEVSDTKIENVDSKNYNNDSVIDSDSENKANGDLENISDNVPKTDESNSNEKSDSSPPKDSVYSNSANWKRISKSDTKNKNDKIKVVNKLSNPLLKSGETFVFDAEKYREAVVTPWYRNQDQPQFFLVAEICWNLTPDSAFPSATHTTFRHYYSSKYAVDLTQSSQPLLDVDHTSARLNLLTPRYVNRKGVALPVSSERTRRAKRDRLDQKQILVPELCRVHPFAAPLWFATVALPCVLYRINALLIADEIRQAVAIDVGLGIPKITDETCPGFQWPPLDFGWSLAEVLSADSEKNDKKKGEDQTEEQENEGYDDEGVEKETEDTESSPEEGREKTINDILQEKEDAENGFEIGTWSNDMASSIPQTEYDDLMQPLPSNLSFCTSASGGTNWCDPVQKPQSKFNPSRAFSVADSDCSYMSSDFDTDDSDLNSEASDEETDTSGFCSSRNSNVAMGVRIEYKTAHEAEAVDLERKKRVTLAPQPCERDDAIDRVEQEEYMKSGDAPDEYKQKFHESVEQHKRDITEKGLLIRIDKTITEILPEPPKEVTLEKTLKTDKDINEIADQVSKITLDEETRKILDDLFPFGTEDSINLLENGRISIENIEKHKRILLADLKKSKSREEIKKLNCFSMVDVDIDSPTYVNEKVVNVGFDSKDRYKEKTKVNSEKSYVSYFEEGKVENGKDFDFDYQPDLNGHPGPSPSLILQALTMSNANDGINLERLETIGDSFLKFAITAYLYCAHPTVHEGKLSHMRSKQVSNLNLYRLGRNKRLGARMIASKFEPHDNWLPPCHKPPATLDVRPTADILSHVTRAENMSGEGCFIPYNLITQHSIPDKSIADCVEALIGAYLLSCGARGALLFMSWLGLRVLPRHTLPARPPKPSQEPLEHPPIPKRLHNVIDSETECSSDEDDDVTPGPVTEDDYIDDDWSPDGRVIGSLRPYTDEKGEWRQIVFGELKAPPSPLLRYIEDPEGELEQMLSGYEALERTLQYRFRDRSLLLQALTHASHQRNRLTDCYQRLEFLGDAILDYLITRHLYEDKRRHSPGALTDLRSALVNNTIFATLAVRHGFHKYFRHMSPGLNEVLTKYVKIQEENGHSISEEHYLIQEDEMEQAEDVEVPKALGDLFESVAGAIFLDSGMSLGAVWKSYVNLMGQELEAFSAAAPKSPVRELLEAEPDTAKFGKPERLADGRRVRVCVEVFGRGAFKGIGRNYRIAKGTAARCALRHLKRHRAHN